MLRPTMRRVASVVFASAVLAGGLAAGVGTATAQSALPDLGSSGTTDPNTPSTATETFENLSVTREVIGRNVLAPSQVVTYRTTISATGAPVRIINRITDHFGGYVPGSAKITAWRDGSMKTENVTPTVMGRDAAFSGNWTVSSDGGKTLTLEVSYRLGGLAAFPAGGFVLDSGFSVQADGLGLKTWDPMGVKVTVRDPNAIELVESLGWWALCTGDGLNIPCGS
ncbi:hypothetical protein [Rhodococcus tukisamuensis]|uniref:Uncharacterized protein n=1 Tax=Rhodococcus tukisamuensis TaxID=168276 RepID=A0A1G7AUG0_9NOCA|nr:hypothetical protein [Rhodococcus tukisamuensis]SDE18352.1 hypothetical protein SAMN05444580_111120 [Rhodococcus tukisamuensis]